MKILNACYDDYANFAHGIHVSMREVGLDVTGAKLKRHPFGYADELAIVQTETMKKLMQETDIVQLFHSDLHILKLCKEVGAKYTVWHTGTRYRHNPPGIAAQFNRAVAKFTDQCEFMITDPKLHYVAAMVKPMPSLIRQPNRPYVVAHYPSKSITKGSPIVCFEMERIATWHPDSMIFEFSDSLVPHPQQLQRMAECDIYFELFAPTQNGDIYGCYGVTAFEAAAMGKIVVTNNSFPNVYPEAYGVSLPFVIANCQRDIPDRVNELLALPEAAMEQRQEETFGWLSKNHNPTATGERVKKILEALI